MISLFKDFKTPKASISYSVNSFYIYSHSEAGIALQEKKLWENCRVALWVGAVISKSTGSFAFWSLRDRPCSHQKMYDKNKKKKHEKKKRNAQEGKQTWLPHSVEIGIPLKIIMVVWTRLYSWNILSVWHHSLLFHYILLPWGFSLSNPCLS